MLVTKKCLICNQTFKRKIVPSREKTTNFCSHSCQMKSAGYKKGHPFYKGGEKGWFKRGHKPHPNLDTARKRGPEHWKWTGNDTNWRYFRKQVLAVFDGLCMNCGGKATIAHHALARRDFPEFKNDMNVGMPLCHQCHLKEHPEIWGPRSHNLRSYDYGS